MQTECAKAFIEILDADVSDLLNHFTLKLRDKKATE